MTSSPLDDNHFVLNAGRSGPFQLIERTSVPWYVALLVAAAAVAGLVATRWQPWGVVVTFVVVTTVIFVAVVAGLRGKAFLDWWEGEVHFVAATDALVGWHGTYGRRARETRFPVGEVLAVATDTRTATPRLVASAAGQSLLLGPLWEVYPAKYERWREWVESRGWTVNDTYIDDPNSQRARPLSVAGDWTEFDAEDGSAQFVWGIPTGPAPSSARSRTRGDWLPAANPKHHGAFTSTLPGAQVTKVCARVGGIEAGASVSEFGGAASAVEIRQGGVIADLEFAVGVDAVAVSHTPDGRVELRFRAAT